jgi:EAL domain-containing protein (putative c-di-GMP-specific phosphodiesterase class I)
MRVLSVPLSVEGREVSIGVSIGVAFAELDGRGAAAADDLLGNADVAMYMAKDRGKGRYQIFEPNMHAVAIERLQLKSDLQRAVNEREFLVHYQPIIALRSGRISGVEALVRWRHPERGMLSPDRFIPLAEETGVINSVGRLVLEEACREGVILQRSCPQTPELTVSVNVSARQLQQPEFSAEVMGILSDTGLAAESLLLEITESAMMADMDLALLRLQELRGLGVRLAVDDFGTGYSSLNYIRQFPLDVLKLDKSFIDELGGSEGEIDAVTGAIIDLAQILELQPVAEGIETADQLQRLLELECELGQGYFFHKPVPKEEVERVVGRQARLPARGVV